VFSPVAGEKKLYTGLIFCCMVCAVKKVSKLNTGPHLQGFEGIEKTPLFAGTHIAFTKRCFGEIFFNRKGGVNQFDARHVSKESLPHVGILIDPWRQTQGVSKTLAASLYVM